MNPPAMNATAATNATTTDPATMLELADPRRRARPTPPDMMAPAMTATNPTGHKATPTS
jgi:hypothetical protein